KLCNTDFYSISADFLSCIISIIRENCQIALMLFWSVHCHIHEITVAFILHIVYMNERNGSTVDAVTLAAVFLRPVVKHMPQMDIPDPAPHFRAIHVVASVLMVGDDIRIHWLGKTRPPALRIIFICT